MNRQFFAGIVAITVATVCVSVPECSGWAPPLDIDSDWKVYAPVGEYADVEAWVDSGGPVSWWQWDWEAGASNVGHADYDYSSNSWGIYGSSGIYDVYVEAGGAGGWDSAYTYVYAVAVTQVISSTSATCVGQNVTFGAITNPPNCASYVTVSWSGGGTPSTGSGSQFTTNWSTPGTKTVIATCGTSTAQKDVQVFANPVAILHYSASTYIGRGETIYFDGSGSFDPDGGGGGTFRGIKKFEWDWDNNGTYDYQENPGIGITSHSFASGGTKTVAMRVTDNDAAEGGPPDKTATDSVTFQVCSKPHVATFWKKTAWEDPDGVLVFIYQWLPTSGTVEDLDGLVGEIVEYPDGDPYQWPLPWNTATPNPTERSHQASSGLGQDTHTTGSFVQPYQANSFSASQEYGFHCNECMPSGLGMNLLGPHSISRQAYWVGPPDSTWRYKIEKTGESAEKDLPWEKLTQHEISANYRSPRMIS